jgi:hypothetical protein
MLMVKKDFADLASLFEMVLPARSCLLALSLLTRIYPPRSQIESTS